MKNIKKIALALLFIAGTFVSGWGADGEYEELFGTTTTAADKPAEELDQKPHVVQQVAFDAEQQAAFNDALYFLKITAADLKSKLSGLYSDINANYGKQREAALNGLRPYAQCDNLKINALITILENEKTTREYLQSKHNDASCISAYFKPQEKSPEVIPESELAPKADENQSLPNKFCQFALNHKPITAAGIVASNAAVWFYLYKQYLAAKAEQQAANLDADDFTFDSWLGQNTFKAFLATGLTVAEAYALWWLYNNQPAVV
ncbi:MAG: hypothetical protein WCT20_04840 [Candidatus Babeliales bacterium]